jgi:hypothetical protein
MPKCKIIALTNPAPGKEAEYHDWYQHTHLPEMLSFPGANSAQRFKLVAKMMGADPNQYLAIYDIEVDDPMAFLAAVGEGYASGKMTLGTASDDATTYTALFVECDEPVLAEN